VEIGEIFKQNLGDSGAKLWSVATILCMCTSYTFSISPELKTTHAGVTE